MKSCNIDTKKRVARSVDWRILRGANLRLLVAPRISSNFQTLLCQKLLDGLKHAHQMILRLGRNFVRRLLMDCAIDEAQSNFTREHRIVVRASIAASIQLLHLQRRTTLVIREVSVRSLRTLVNQKHRSDRANRGCLPRSDALFKEI